MKISKIMDVVVGDPRYCPNCDKDLRGKDILAVFLEKYGDYNKALETAEMYGYSVNKPQYFMDVIGIETEQYDGITWWKCPHCEALWKRFDWSDPKYVDIGYFSKAEGPECKERQ